MRTKPIKILTWLSLCLAILFLFQITYAQEISFGNDIVDHLLHFGSVSVALITILLILSLLLIVAKRRWHRIIVILAIIPVGLSFLLTSLFIPYFLVTKPRYYFHADNGYQYYVVSERFAAFEGSSEVRFYKEKPIMFFIKQRLLVTENELKQIGINPYEQYAKLWKLYGP